LELEQAGIEMATAAIEYPAIFNCTKELRQLLSSKRKENNIVREMYFICRKSALALLPQAEKLPQASTSGADDLSEKYFDFLQQ
jgi:hypothetical protein